MNINFDALLRLQVFISNIDASLRDQRRFWTQYVSPFAYGEIDEIFYTGGRGLWPDLDPIYAARKDVTHPGQGILRREDAYYRAATGPNRAQSVYDVSSTELVIGTTVEHAAYHEEGRGVRGRPVYELIAAGERFEERLGQLGEKYQQETITSLGGGR